MVSNVVKIELAHINTNHPDFIGGSRAVAELMERMQRGEVDAGSGDSKDVSSPDMVAMS